jgi:tetratricopeptide (TPR) repeat protein
VNRPVYDNYDDADFYYNRAVVYNDLKDYSQAMRDLRQSLRLNPALSIDVHTQMARSHFGLCQYTECMDATTKVINLDSNYSYAYYVQVNS